MGPPSRKSDLGMQLRPKTGSLTKTFLSPSSPPPLPPNSQRSRYYSLLNEKVFQRKQVILNQVVRLGHSVFKFCTSVSWSVYKVSCSSHDLVTQHLIQRAICQSREWQRVTNENISYKNSTIITAKIYSRDDKVLL